MSEPTPLPGDEPRLPNPAERKPATEKRAATGFRWQALFQRSTDALFLLDRQRRLRFVNLAWEQLTGIAALDVRLLSCKRQRPAAAVDSMSEVLAHALCPPPEVMQGRTALTRRRIPAGDTNGRRWWDVEFLPLRAGDHAVGILGRILPIDEDTAPTATPLPEKLVALRERVVRRYDLSLLDSAVPAVRRLAEQVRLAATLSVPIFLTGEPGTGKETLARIIHYQSAARERPLAVIEGGRLPAAVLSALLFSERGPVPGAPGAIYLREPSQLPRDLQLRLCALIATESAPRILAGCCGNPVDEVREGRLLGELYAAFPFVLEVTPLRERTADLPALVRRFLERSNETGTVRVSGLTAEARETIRDHRWPDNLRELHDTIVSACAHTSGTMIDVADLPASLRLRRAAGAAPMPERQLPLDTLLAGAERRLIELALRRAKGNRGRAAEILGIWRARLLRRIEALGLAEPGDKDDEA
jgi:hypothetical protein